VPRALQCHQLKARGEEFLLPLEHLRAPMRRLFVPVVASPPRPRGFYASGIVLHQSHTGTSLMG
jgi:hypothetical protein